MNKLMAQAFSASPNRKILIVDDGNPEQLRDTFADEYKIDKKRIEIWKGKASTFLLEELNQTSIY